jgi:hypothetical protein
MSPLERRDVLRATAGVGAAVALPGCALRSGPRHRLYSRPEDGTDPVDLFRWEPASNAFHYDEADAAALADELRETGSVASIEIPLVEPLPSGQDGYPPAYTSHDGTYYRVSVSEQSVAFDRWVVWMEPLDTMPDGVEYTTEPRAGLSESDIEILDWALDRAVVSAMEGRDHAALPPTDRGVVFFDPMDPDASALVPDLPFEYALIEPDSDVAPEEVAVRAHVEWTTVETTWYVHDLEAVTDDRDEFVAHLEREHVDARFPADADADDAREVLDAATDLGGYHEEPPLSDGFASVLDALGLGNASIPDGSPGRTWWRYYEYDGAYYRGDFRISRP